jgi:hypothetical protein
MKVVERTSDQSAPRSPWLGVAPIIEVYRERGHRRLAVWTDRPIVQEPLGQERAAR